MSFMSVLRSAHILEVSSVSCMEMCLLFIVMAINVLGETPRMSFSVIAALIKANEFWF